jgi:hypothetical protein
LRTLTLENILAVKISLHVTRDRWTLPLIIYHRRRTLRYLEDRRFWTAVVALLVVPVAGDRLLSVLAMPPWTIFALTWGSPLVCLTVLAFIPIIGDDGERHPSLELRRVPGGS